MEEQFKTWAVVELFGHTKIAGEVSEKSLAGGAMLRIDVPEIPGNPAFTRFVNISAVYAINPVDPDTAKQAAASLMVKPIESWDIRKMLEKLRALPEPSSEPEY